VVLTDVVTAMAPRPGTALDLGCGHGGDAVWLASLGWGVTAVDVAATALERVASLATARNVADRVITERHDLARSFPDGTFDLVSACCFHTPMEIPRHDVLRRAAGSVAPGGLLVIVEHRSPRGPGAPTTTCASRPRRRPSTPWASTATGTPIGWRHRDGRPGPGGQTATVIDNIIVVRRIG
jgi:SAM-dependent methyltransferase